MNLSDYVKYYVILHYILSLTHKNQQSDFLRIALYWPYCTLREKAPTFNFLGGRKQKFIDPK